MASCGPGRASAAGCTKPSASRASAVVFAAPRLAPQANRPRHPAIDRSPAVAVTIPKRSDSRCLETAPRPLSDNEYLAEVFRKKLGGKSPAIVHADCDLPRAVERIVRGKLLNAGQTCIAPDYALVPRSRVEDFLRLFRETASRFYPRILDNPDYTSIINDRHYARLMEL